MKKQLHVTAKALRRRYHVTLLTGAALLFIGIAAYGWVSIRSERVAIEKAMQSQAQQLQLSINDTLDITQSHVASMRRSVERGLTYPELSDERLFPRMRERAKGAPLEAPLNSLPRPLKQEVGSIHIDPQAVFDKTLLQRDMAAASNILNIAAGAHAWHRALTWSYFYDAHERWMLLYPPLSQEELFVATDAKEVQSALKAIFKADGTFPILSAGPVKNPTRQNLWTSPYLDAGGKGMMVTFLAPVYLRDLYVGAVGADVSLQTLESVLLKHPVPLGRALICDPNGWVVADSQGGLQGAKTRVKVNDLLPGEFPFAASQDDQEWTRFPLKGTGWSLLIHVPDTAVRAHLMKTLRPYFAMAIALMLAVIGLAWIQNRRYARPALLLAEYMDTLESQHVATAPRVPGIWNHWFSQVAEAAAERRRLWAQAQAQAVHLEETVEERTGALLQANDTLKQLAEIGKELTSDLDSDHVFETLHKRLIGLLNVTSFRIQLLTPDGQGVSSAYGIEEGKRLGPLYVPITSEGTSFVSRCFSNKEEVYFQSITPDVQAAYQVPGTLETRSALFYPLLVGERAIGVMTVQSTKENAYSENDRLIFRTMCSYAAIALENAINYAKLKETQQQLIASEKFAALGSMVVGVAHELNTPIGNGLLVASSMESQAKELQATVSKGELKRGTLEVYLAGTTDATQLLVSSLNKAAGLVSAFKRVAEDRTSEQRRIFDIATTTDEVLATLKHRIEMAGHRVEIEIPQGILVDGYPGPYGELLTQMVDNALAHAFAPGFSGVIQIRTKTNVNGWLEWTFTDNGSGIATENQKRIFDPFFTTHWDRAVMA